MSSDNSLSILAWRQSGPRIYSDSYLSVFEHIWVMWMSQICLVVPNFGICESQQPEFGSSEDKTATFDNGKIDQVDSLTYLDSNTSKDGGCNEDAKSRIAKVKGVFFVIEKVWKKRKISLRTNIIILEAKLMTLIKYDSEAWVIRKNTEEHFLDVFQRNCLRTVLGTRLTVFLILDCTKSVVQSRLLWL